MQKLLEQDIKIHPITKKTLDLFVKKVKEHEGDNLLRIILFCSVAREEANQNSDIDVLVILKECPFMKRMEICDICADIEWDMDFNENAYLQTLTMSEEESRGLDFYSLMINVYREGVVLYDSEQ